MTITVSCPACSTSFPVDPAKIPEGGVRAQCSECPEIFGVDEPDAAGVESSSVEATESASDPSAPVALDEMDVPPEVQSPFGADAEVVTDFAAETSDEFGEREITFDLDAEGDAEAETADADFGAIELDSPADGLAAEEAPAAAETTPAATQKAPAAAEAAPAASGGAIQFGRRSPEDKAKSLARSLVSDLIAYNPDKHKAALASGTLVQVFEEEIGKSWKEYKDQVDPEVIGQGTFFNDALNELLANGESVFSVEG